MTSNENRFLNLLLNELPHQFTGKLEVKSSQKSWKLFFCLGRLAWISGGEHPNRRFHRILHQFCPNVSLGNIRLRNGDFVSCDYYHVLSVLKRRNILTPTQVKSVVLSNLKEVLFDILQQQSLELLAYNLSSKGLEKSLILMSVMIRPEVIIVPVNKLWLEWQQSNLAEYSPNLVPAIAKPKLLKQLAKPNSYNTIIQLVNDQNTLREIAILVKKDLRQLTLFLIPYVRNKLIIFKEVPDKQRLEGTPKLLPDIEVKKAPQKERELIVCVDDSKEMCYLLEKTMNQGGYRFIGIQDSIKALPIIIEAKPDLIFLDLIMPIANGYEICTQLRRAPIFDNTPIIIITGNDGVVDRVRAKMVGATGYMTKPIEPKKVLAVVKRYLQNPPLKSEAKFDEPES